MILNQNIKVIKR